MQNVLNQPQKLWPFLAESKLINFKHPNIDALAKAVAKEASSEIDVVRRCFEFVRDEIHHSGDSPDNSITTTVLASDVLKYKTGWCYAKSHLLAALLRANRIPTGFCYQRLSCSEYKSDIFCLHGLNAVYLAEFGWYRLDPRGNKTGVNAQFSPPVEQLAFTLSKGEQDVEGIFDEPLDIVINALKTNQNYQEMILNLPDISFK